MKIIKKEVPTFLFNDYYILALDKKWAQVLGEPLTFKAMIDKTGKLHLVSTNSIPGYVASKRRTHKNWQDEIQGIEKNLKQLAKVKFKPIAVRYNTR